MISSMMCSLCAFLWILPTVVFGGTQPNMPYVCILLDFRGSAASEQTVKFRAHVQSIEQKASVPSNVLASFNATIDILLTLLPTIGQYNDKILYLVVR